MTQTDGWHSFRTTVFLLTAGMVGLGANTVRLCYFGVYNEKQSIYWDVIQAPRGAIYDRTVRNIMAMDLLVKDVCADPDYIIRNRGIIGAASALSEMLDLPADSVATQLAKPGRHYTVIRRSVSPRLAAEVERRVPGVFAKDATVRYYPHGSLMGQVLGFVCQEGYGGAGIEQAMNRYLAGTPGLLEGRKDGSRRKDRAERELYTERVCSVPPIKGAEVTLTLDLNIQHMVEQALDELMDIHNAKMACAIVQRVNTGEILAMGNRPAFDPNRFRSSDPGSMKNFAIAQVFEPGSVLKIVTIAAALNERTVTPETQFDCENGTWNYQGVVLHDSHPNGVLSVADIIKKSSNIGAAKVALTLERHVYYRYLRSFGLARKTGVDIPGEEAGLLRPVSEWSKICPTRIAMGHSVAVTALQLASIINTIANDGVTMIPYVVARVAKGDGTVLSHNCPVPLGRPITHETAAIMRRLLTRVTEPGGTAPGARVDGYAVAGKTGTAQKPVPGGYSSSQHVACFMGFLPADAPQVSIVVVADEPHPMHTGGRVAAPTFARIAGQIVRYLGIQPSPAWTSARI